MPKQILKTCLDCEKIILKNQELLTCSQCLQLKHIKRTGRKAQITLKLNLQQPLTGDVASVISHFRLLPALKRWKEVDRSTRM